MKVVISNNISIKVSAILAQRSGSNVLETLKNKFTYKNPDYVEAKKYGRSTYGIDEFIRMYHILGDEIKIGRGGIGKVEKHLKACKIDYEIVDFTQVCEPVTIFRHPRFSLRPDQELSIKIFQEELKKASVPQGILLAQTSYGKTFSMTYLINEIGQPALVMVHTTFMQKQWIDELVKNFNIDKSAIGGAGGVFAGKPRVGKINVALYHSMSKKEINVHFRDKIGLILVDEVQKVAVRQFQEALKPFRARYRLGCSASHERKDGKTFIITDLVGDVLYEAEASESNSKIHSNIFGTKSKWNPATDIDWDKRDEEGEVVYKDTYTTYITEAGRNLDRNILIAKSAVRKVKEKKIVIIFVERKEQAGALAKILSKFRVHLLIGKVAPKELAQMDIPLKAKEFLENNSDPERALDTVKELALKRELDIIIATQKGEVGLSIETLDHAIVTTPVGNNLERFNQLIGRVERQHKEDRLENFGKKETPTVEVIVDNWDSSYSGWSSIREGYKEQIIRNPYLQKKG